MERVRTQRFAEAVTDGLSSLKPEHQQFVHSITDFFEGDPLFAGLHSTEDSTDRGVENIRSYRTTAHVCYPWHIERPLSEQRTTIVLCGKHALAWHTVTHEVGHALHCHLWDQSWRWLDFPRVWAPGGHYDGSSYLDFEEERFAEAFVSWLGPKDRPRDPWWETYIYQPEVWEFFDRYFSDAGW